MRDPIHAERGGRPLPVRRDWAREFIAVPYVERGEGLDGWDCWGLLKWVGENRLGWRVDQTAPERALGPRERARVLSAGLCRWSEVERASGRPCAVLMGNANAQPIHVGIYTGFGAVLHAERGAGTLVTPLDDQALPPILGFYEPHG